MFSLIYDELLRLAQQQLHGETGGHVLSSTALVNEAYLRLIDCSRIKAARRAQFMAVAATAMRRILVDHARSARSAGEPGLPQRVTLDFAELTNEQRASLLLAVNDALERLGRFDGRQAKVAECRFFGGMTEEETAEALGIGLPAAKRDWARAKVWLHNEIAGKTTGRYPRPSATE